MCKGDDISHEKDCVILKVINGVNAAGLHWTIDIEWPREIIVEYASRETGSCPLLRAQRSTHTRSSSPGNTTAQYRALLSCEHVSHRPPFNSPTVSYLLRFQNQISNSGICEFCPSCLDAGLYLVIAIRIEIWRPKCFHWHAVPANDKPQNATASTLSPRNPYGHLTETCLSAAATVFR